MEDVFVFITKEKYSAYWQWYLLMHVLILCSLTICHCTYWVTYFFSVISIKPIKAKNESWCKQGEGVLRDFAAPWWQSETVATSFQSPVICSENLVYLGLTEHLNLLWKNDIRPWEPKQVKTDWAGVKHGMPIIPTVYSTVDQRNQYFTLLNCSNSLCASVRNKVVPVQVISLNTGCKSVTRQPSERRTWHSVVTVFFRNTWCKHHTVNSRCTQCYNA